MINILLTWLESLTDKLRNMLTFMYSYTVIKNKLNFPHTLGNSEGLGAQSYMTNDLLIYGEHICASPHILGSPSSCMTLHPIPSEFPYI
jgi:hypothetical protein